MIDVLIIDDDLAFAESWSDRIAETMQLRALPVSNPDEALRIAGDPGIKIAVIDEVLTGTDTDGVALGIAIRQVDPRIRCILLSGEATGTQITAAYDSGFLRHIHKNDALDQLQPAIRRYLIQYGTELSRSIDAASKALVTKKTKRFKRQEISYYLLSIDSVDRDYVSDLEWVSHTQINSGESLEETREITWTRSDTLESTSEARVASDMRVIFPGLDAALRSEVVSRERLTSLISNQRSYRLVRRISLPSEPRNLRSRVFQVAPVYVRVGLTVVARCSCCGRDESIKGYLYFPRSRYATRQEDFLSDGNTQITFTGNKDVG